MPRKNTFSKKIKGDAEDPGSQRPRRQRPSKTRRGLGLYRRTSLLAIIISLFCVVGFASVSYFVTSSVLLNRQSDAIIDQAVDHASQAESLILSENLFINDVDADSAGSDATDTVMQSLPLYRFMDSISSGSGPRIAILLGGDSWFSENPLRFGQQTLPAGFVETAKEGNPVQMRTRIGGELLLVVGIPVESVDMVFFEGGSLQATVDILNILRAVILVGGGITLAISVTIGVFVVRRSFKSIRVFRRAAENIGRGSFHYITDPVDRDFQEMRESFNDMQRSIAERIEREQRFASEVSHELRSPLTTLVTSVELLRQHRREMPPRTQTALDLLVTEIARFRQLLIDLLDISRPPDSIKLDLEVLDAEKFFKQIVARSSASVPVVLENGPVSFTADARLISQAVTNLLENASRYAGGAIGIHVRSKGSHLLVSVDDAGPGVKEEEREKIFERFSRGEVGAHRKRGLGTGLGLALARERVSLHKGEIWVEDVPNGEGARFVVKLPLKPEVDDINKAFGTGGG